MHETLHTALGEVAIRHVHNAFEQPYVCLFYKYRRIHRRALHFAAVHEVARFFNVCLEVGNHILADICRNNLDSAHLPRPTEHAP